MSTDRIQAMPEGPGFPTPEQIAQRAYQLWEADGRPSDAAERHWHRAEEELVAAENAREENDRRRDTLEQNAGAGPDRSTKRAAKT